MREHFDTNSEIVEPPKEHLLPNIAVVLTFVVPIFVAIISTIVRVWEAFFFTIAMLSPVAGVLTAIIALCLGKKRIGTTGQIISIIVIAVPLCGLAALVALLFVFTNGTFVFHM